MRWFQLYCKPCEIPWYGWRQERPGGYRFKLMVWEPPGRLAPLLHWTFTGPPTQHRIKARLDVRGQGRMILSSTLDAITTLTHIMVFPVDRPGMPDFVLFFYSWEVWNAKLHNMQEKQCISPSTKVFVCIVNCGCKLRTSQRWTKNGFVVEVKWSFQGYVSLASCISHTLPLSSKLNWINVVCFAIP